MPLDPISVERVGTSRRAVCSSCARLHPNATRQRVRQHVLTTGHTVRFVVEDVTIYGPRAEAKP